MKSSSSGYGLFDGLDADLAQKCLWRIAAYQNKYIIVRQCFLAVLRLEDDYIGTNLANLRTALDDQLLILFCRDQKLTISIADP